MTTTDLPRKTIAAFIAVVLLAAAMFLWVRPPDSIRLHADFAQADGMFVGSNVAILGVHVGRVERLEPMGDRVRLTMSLPADTKVPANVEAWVMSPNVVSDQYVELTPPYRSGGTIADGAVIPVERTHSPIKWDKLVKSVNELLVTFGPQGANSDSSVGRVLEDGAKILKGRGPQVRKAILSLSQASDVVNGELPDIEALLKNLDALVQVLADNRGTVDSLTSSVDSVSAELAEQEGNIATAIESLSGVLTEVGQLVDKHGKSMSRSIKRLAGVSVELARHQRELVEILDTMPLGAENLSRAITDDGRLRVRLNFSTNSEQSERMAQLCDNISLWFCTGRGLTNPIHLPPDLPLGLLGGGN